MKSIVKSEVKNHAKLKIFYDAKFEFIKHVKYHELGRNVILNTFLFEIPNMSIEFIHLYIGSMISNEIPALIMLISFFPRAQ